MIHLNVRGAKTNFIVKGEKMNFYSKRESKITLTHLLLLFICAASMNVINRYYYFMFLGVGIFLLKPKRRLHLDPVPMLMLFILGLSWMVFSPSSTVSVFGVLKPYAYLLCYIMGMGLLDDDVENSGNKTSYKLFYAVLIAVALGSLLHYVLNWVTNIGAIERNTVDFWTQTVIAATGQAALACIPIGVSVACLISPVSKRIKIAAIVALLLILGYNLILSGRTLFLMVLIVATVAFLYRLANQKDKRIKLVLILLIVATTIIIAYRMDLFGIRSFIESSPFYDRFFSENNTTDLNEDGRMDKKIYHIKNMYRFLWGGANIRQEIGHAHDLLLDTYDESGIFAFVALAVYMCTTLAHLFKITRTKSIPFQTRQLVLCVYIVAYIEFFVEPILQGVPWLFAAFCLIDGYVSRIIRHDRKVEIRSS